MDRLDISERFAEMWRKARTDAGKSQEWVARALGVSKKTIQNWEAGIASPSQMKGFEFFSVLGLQPLPYYLPVLYPDKYEGKNEDAAIEEALMAFVKSCTSEQKKKLYYWSFAKHGSSPFGVLEMIIAHLHTPLKDRINIAQSILTNYEMAEKMGNLVNSDSIQPDTEVLTTALEKGKEAVLSGKDSYTIIIGGKDVAL